MKTVALVGNPNCGKTTIFNRLTGANQHTGNYSGVTVEKKEGFCVWKNHSFSIIDLPGLYSLSSTAPDQKMASQFLIFNKPDLIINIIDASNLHRHLYLTIQLLELNLPVILVVNMIDQVGESHLDLDILEEHLGAKILTTVGSQNIGLDRVLENIGYHLFYLTPEEKAPVFQLKYDAILEKSLTQIETILQSQTHLGHHPRWLAIRLLEDTFEARHYLIQQAITQLPQIEYCLKQAIQRIHMHFQEEIATLFTQQRYAFLSQIMPHILLNFKQEISFSDKVDRLITHRFLGLPLFFCLIYFLFFLVFEIGEIPQAWIETSLQFFTHWVRTVLPAGELQHLVIEGILGGVGIALSFLPPMIILYFGMALMEDSGYMARVAFLMDGMMKRFGLHGKSCIPLILGFGCNVPAILSTRTLENHSDRVMTILIIPLMSCSAKLAVYTLLIGTFFPKEHGPIILLGLYFLGLILGFILSLSLKNTFFKYQKTTFIMEMPHYHLPTLRNLCLHVWERIYLYLKKASTVILTVSVLMWFATNYPHLEQPASPQQKLAYSYAGQMGQLLTPVMEPLGLNWQVGVSLTSALIAKEVFISTFTVINNVENHTESTAPPTNIDIAQTLLSKQILTPLSSLALMVFILIYSPCIATLSVIQRETNSWNWAFFSFFFNTIIAWMIAFLTYQLGSLFI